MTEVLEETYRSDSHRAHKPETPDEQEYVEETGETPSERYELALEEVTEERVRQALREIDDLPRLPMQLIEKYARLAAQRGQMEELEDGSWYAEVRYLPGVWAQASSEDKVLGELKAVVRDWVLLKIEDKDRDLPEIGTINLNVL